MKKAIFLIFYSFIFCDSFAQIEDLLIGTKKTMQIQAFRTNVKWNENSRINYEYTAPRGWMILSFKPIVISKKGTVLYTLSAIHSTFKYKTTTGIYATFIELLELASEKNVAPKYDSVILNMRNDYESCFNKLTPTYSKIITAGSVAGNKRYRQRTAGHFYLDLEITLVYMPDTEEQFLRSLEYFRQVIHLEE